MLNVGKEFIKVSTLGSLISSFSLVEIIIGLGACYPNFKEENPSKIIAGLGGTLALIISLIYVGFAVVLLALPFQAYMLGRINYFQLASYNNLVILILFLVSLSSVLFALYKGKQSLERAEF